MSNTEPLTKEKELEIEKAYKELLSSFHALPKEIKEEILSDVPAFLSRLNLQDEDNISLIDMDLSNVNLKKN